MINLKKPQTRKWSTCQSWLNLTLGRKLSYDGRELGDAPSLKVIYESLFWIHLVVVVNYPSLLMNSAIKEVIIASICCHYTWKWSGNSSCIYYKGRSLIGHIAKKVFKKSQKISRCRRISCVNLVCSDMSIMGWFRCTRKCLLFKTNLIINYMRCFS